MKQGHHGFSARLFLIVLLSVSLHACSGKQAAPDAGAIDEQVWYQRTADDTPLPVPYKNIVFHFTATPEIERDYPESTAECEIAAVSWLNRSGEFSAVRGQDAGEILEGETLLVDVYIPEMRIVSGQARFWLGVTVGSSYMNIDVTLKDAASGEVLREKHLSSTANPFASAYSRGHTDRSIDDDMGRILADYLRTILPSERGM